MTTHEKVKALDPALANILADVQNWPDGPDKITAREIINRVAKELDTLYGISLDHEPMGWIMELKCSGYGNTGKGCGVMNTVVEADIDSGKLRVTESLAGARLQQCVTYRCSACGADTDVTDPLPAEIRARLML